MNSGPTEINHCGYWHCYKEVPPSENLSVLTPLSSKVENNLRPKRLLLLLPKYLETGENLNCIELVKTGYCEWA